MRIGIDARVLYQAELKGIGRYLQYLILNYEKLGTDHQFYLFYSPKKTNKISAFENKQIISVPLNSISEELWEQWSLPRAVKFYNIDVFHSVANTTMLFPPCPTVVTIHDVMSHRQAREWGRREDFYWNFIQRLAYRNSARFMTETHFAKSKIMEELNLPSEKIEVINLGIDGKYGNHSSKSSDLNHFSVKKPYLFVVGSRLKRKNIPVVLEAFELVLSKNPNLSLVVSGLKGFESIEEQVSKSSRPDRIKLLDYVSEDELVALYKNAFIFIFPSLEEGYGFPPLEAMACGAPVIASDASCIPEVAGGGALLVDCRKPVVIAEAILRLSSCESLRQELIMKGFRHIQKFKWDITARKTLELYEEVARS